MVERLLRHWYVALVAIALASAPPAEPGRIAWGQEGPAARVPPLIDALDDPAAGVRKGAASDLGRIGKAAMPALIDAVGDPDAGVRKGALILALSDLDPEVRREAAEATANIAVALLPERPQAGDGMRAIDTAVSALIVALRDPDPNVRREAASGLGRTGPGARAAVPALIDALGDRDLNVRRRAVWVLGRIGETAVQGAAAALRDRDREVRRWAAEALGEIGLLAAAELQALIDALRDPDVDVRKRAASALGRIGATVPAALRDPDPGVRQQAADALSRIAESALPALTEALGDPDAGVRREAAGGLANIAVALQEADATRHLPDLRKAGDAITAVHTSEPYFEEQATVVRRAVAYLNQLWWFNALVWRWLPS